VLASPTRFVRLSQCFSALQKFVLIFLRQGVRSLTLDSLRALFCAPPGPFSQKLCLRCAAKLLPWRAFTPW
jgi:hypothetical protein